MPRQSRIAGWGTVRHIVSRDYSPYSDDLSQGHLMEKIAGTTIAELDARTVRALHRACSELGISQQELIRRATFEYLRSLGYFWARYTDGVQECDLDSIRLVVRQALNASTSWDEFAAYLARHDLEYFERGGGLAVRSKASGNLVCKASEVGPGYSALMKKFRTAFPGHSASWLADKVLGGQII